MLSERGERCRSQIALTSPTVKNSFIYTVCVANGPEAIESGEPSKIHISRKSQINSLFCSEGGGIPSRLVYGIFEAPNAAFDWKFPRAASFGCE